MRAILAIGFLLGLGSTVLAQTADPRALESCQAASKAFTDIAQCLPAADVAVRSLDAFSTIFPPPAQTVKERCLELNDHLDGALTCARRAVEQAVELRSALPEGASLNDSVFDAVSDKGLAAKFQAAIDSERARYPNQQIWGGGLYYSYK